MIRFSDKVKSISMWYANLNGYALPLSPEQLLNAVVAWVDEYGGDHIYFDNPPEGTEVNVGDIKISTTTWEAQQWNGREWESYGTIAGLAATIEIAETTTLPAGSSATVENIGTSSAARLKFGIPQGAQGPAGPTGQQGPQGEPGRDGTNGADGRDGAAATIEVAETTTLPAGSSATVENVGTSSAARLKFGIPQGAQGPAGPTGQQGPQGVPGRDGTNGTNGTDGAAATIEIAETTTLPAGSSATVENIGTSSAARLKFGIPQGQAGQSGQVTFRVVNVTASGTIGGGDLAAIASSPEGVVLIDEQNRRYECSGTPSGSYIYTSSAADNGLTLYTYTISSSNGAYSRTSSTINVPPPSSAKKVYRHKLAIDIDANIAGQEAHTYTFYTTIYTSRSTKYTYSDRDSFKADIGENPFLMGCFHVNPDYEHPEFPDQSGYFVACYPNPDGPEMEMVIPELDISQVVWQGYSGIDDEVTEV